MSESLLLRPAEAAELLSMSRSRVYQLCQSGDLPGVVRLGGSVRIHRPTLEAWLVQQAIPETAGALVGNAPAVIGGRRGVHRPA